MLSLHNINEQSTLIKSYSQPNLLIDHKINQEDNKLFYPYGKLNEHNPCQRSYKHIYPQQFEINKGEELGYFSFGSTIALIFEANNHFQFSCHRGQQILVGESIGDIVQ